MFCTALSESCALLGWGRAWFLVLTLLVVASAIRERTGRSAEGRTLLGRIVDPLGLFSRSELTKFSQEDER